MANISKLKVNGTTYDITAKKVSGTYSGNGGQQGPGYFGKPYAGFLMSNASVNSDTNYKNWLYMDNYGSNDAGGATAFGVSRVAPRAFLMQSDAKRSSWNNYAELLSTYNYNTYAPKKDGTGASGTWGISISGKANTAGTADTSKACSGNSATATKATQDSAGQQINTTYIKGLSISGNTITYTKGNGGTGSITVPTGAGAKGYIVESKYNADGSWYRKWSDGWLEQGGFCNVTSSWDIITVNLLKPMKNTNYTVLKSFNTTIDDTVASFDGAYVQAYAKTTTSFKTIDGATNAKTVWYAFGQSA